MTYTTHDAVMERYREPYRGSVQEARPANAVELIRQRLSELGKEIELKEATIASLRESLAGRSEDKDAKVS